jgi:hypothetical protein
VFEHDRPDDISVATNDGVRAPELMGLIREPCGVDAPNTTLAPRACARFPMS